MEQPDQHHFFYKRLIVECDQWISRHVVCFANQMYHTEEEKHAFIKGIGEKIARQIMPEQAGFALMIAETIYILVEQEAWIEYWKNQLASPLRLMSDIEAITRQTENHHNLQKPLQVKYHYGTDRSFIDEVRLNPAEVVCVLSYAKDDKRIILERKAHGEGKFKWAFYILDRQYLPNGNGLSYDSLRDYLDPLKIHLVATNKAIFNEAFYHYDGTNIILNPDIKLKISIKDFEDDNFRTILLSKRPEGRNKVHQDLNACKENKRNHLNALQNLSSFYTYHKAMLEGK